MHHHTHSILAIFLSVSASAFSLPATAADAAAASAAAAPAAAANKGSELRQDIAEGANSVGEYANDALITTKVKAALIADDSIKALEISVETIDKVVYLTGEVQTEAQKATAEQLARDVNDVKSVVNHLKLAAG